jgi:hypothetical protein
MVGLSALKPSSFLGIDSAVNSGTWTVSLVDAAILGDVAMTSMMSVP